MTPAAKESGRGECAPAAPLTEPQVPEREERAPQRETAREGGGFSFDR